jgi:LCP family protein required for cell wall assembly
MLDNFEQPESVPETPKGRFSFSRRTVLTIVIVGIIVLFLCIGGVVVTATLWNTPMGPALAIPTEMPAVSILPTAEPAEAAEPAPPQPTAEPAPTSEPQPAEVPATVCGESGSWNILLLGVDSPLPMLPRGPLAIRMVKVDFSGQSAAVFSFPRDLLVSVQGLEGLGIQQTTLLRSYLSAVDQAGYSESGAINLLANALNDNFGARADHYVSIRLSNLALLIDSLGGVDVYLPAAYDGRPVGLPFYLAGYHHMTGIEAITYGVAPTAADQWNAADRQNQIFQALRVKVLSPAVLPNIPSLVNQFFQIVATDFTPKQVLDLACIAQEIPTDRVVFSGVAPSDVTPAADGSLIPIGDAIRTKSQQLLDK